MGESNDNQAGVAGQRPRETFERSRGPLFPPLGNKQLNCPKNPAHLREGNDREGDERSYGA